MNVHKYLYLCICKKIIQTVEEVESLLGERGRGNCPQEGRVTPLCLLILP